jgi:hypothetical protein
VGAHRGDGIRAACHSQSEPCLRLVSCAVTRDSQLANYREHLSKPEHIELVDEKYGVALNGPRYGLIVGNYENFDQDDVAAAKRRYPEFCMVDYDTILQLYLMHENAVPRNPGQPVVPPALEKLVRRAALRSRSAQS